MPRKDGRANNELRPAIIQLGVQQFAEGSVLIEVGQTRVICSASVEERVPGFLRGEGQGWITAEYGMLPRSTLSRTTRERGSGTSSGRVQEIQRLIGRSLRSIADLKALGERTVILDCDVLQADGGTRTAAITGAYVALDLALRSLIDKRVLRSSPLQGMLAATSVGVVGDALLLDLNYEEDFKASVDFNVVMSDSGEIIELQGTAEEKPFTRRTMDKIIDLADLGIRELIEIQREALSRMR